MDFVEEMMKEISDHEYDKYCSLVRIRELNGKETIIYICYFNIKRAQYGRLIKHKSCSFSNGGMQKWGVNLWDTY